MSYPEDIQGARLCYVDGGHEWAGGGRCVRCDERLRCGCGRFVREDDFDRHLREDCPYAFAEMLDERRSIEATFG